MQRSFSIVGTTFDATPGNTNGGVTLDVSGGTPCYNGAALSLAGTAGHICGAGLTSFLTRRNVNVKYILLIPIVLLEICYEIYIYVLNMKQDEENENNLSSSQQQSSQQKDKKEVNKKGTNKKNEDNSLASNFKPIELLTL